MRRYLVEGRDCDSKKPNCLRPNDFDSRVNKPNCGIPLLATKLYTYTFRQVIGCACVCVRAQKSGLNLIPSFVHICSAHNMTSAISGPSCGYGEQPQPHIFHANKTALLMSSVNIVVSRPIVSHNSATVLCVVDCLMYEANVLCPKLEPYFSLHFVFLPINFRKRGHSGKSNGSQHKTTSGESHLIRQKLNLLGK